MPRTIRLASGLVLFAFVASHLTNHALGLVSLDAMGAGRTWFVFVWRSLPGTVALYGALAVHVGFALAALYRRRTLLRMPRSEAAQLVLGFAIPLLLVSHVVGTRVEDALTGSDTGYLEVVRTLWVQAPWVGARQSAALVIAWIHGCLGLHFWLGIRPWYRRAAPLLYAAALLVPVLALLGFSQAGKEVARLHAASPGLTVQAAPDEHAAAVLDRVRTAAYGGFAGALLIVLGARGLRAARRRRHRVAIAYPDGRVVAVPRGTSVLEASRLAGIPHQSVCGGRGRCSTCRVRVSRGAEALPLPAHEERMTLQRIGAPPNVRLACQLRPTADLAVVPLVRPARALAEAGYRMAGLRGRDREVAILFCDLRGFTRLAELKLPYDVVFLLDSWWDAMERCVELAGGRVAHLAGDGLMAVFGLKAAPPHAARQALAAAREMRSALEELNRGLRDELPASLRVAIGLHAGPAIVGETGHGLTVIGDTVNVASRLETLAKELDAELVVSDTICTLGGLDLSAFEGRKVAVRGRAAPLDVRIVPHALDLPG